MKDDAINHAIEQALAPLQADIAALKAAFAALLITVPKPQDLPVCVKDSHKIISTIPKETLSALKVTHVRFDGAMPWFVLVREDGTRISIKRNKFDFRLRLRSSDKALIKELNPSLNGLVAALNSLV